VMQEVRENARRAAVLRGLLRHDGVDLDGRRAGCSVAPVNFMWSEKPLAQMPGSALADPERA
jgi:hypothetical protein